MKKHVGLLGLELLLVLATLLLSVCNKDSPTQPQPPSSVKEDPSFAQDIQPIFNNNCTSSGCHNATASGGMILLQGQAYSNLVNVTSSEDLTKKRVQPNDANNSYIIIKLEGRQSFGGRMPLGTGPLDSNSIQNIKNWINKGAKNN